MVDTYDRYLHNMLEFDVMTLKLVQCQVTGGVGERCDWRIKLERGGRELVSAAASAQLIEETLVESCPP